jgi:Autoinducer binding domain
MMGITTHKVLETIQAVEHAGNSSAIIELFTSFAELYGFKAIYIAQLVNPANVPQDQILYVTNWPKELIERRLARRHKLEDPIARCSLRSTRPFTWSQARQFASRTGMAGCLQRTCNLCPFIPIAPDSADAWSSDRVTMTKPDDPVDVQGAIFHDENVMAAQDAVTPTDALVRHASDGARSGKTAQVNLGGEQKHGGILQSEDCHIARLTLWTDLKFSPLCHIKLEVIRTHA